jgi:hypothetical protein
MLVCYVRLEMQFLNLLPFNIAYLTFSTLRLLHFFHCAKLKVRLEMQFLNLLPFNTAYLTFSTLRLLHFFHCAKLKVNILQQQTRIINS